MERLTRTDWKEMDSMECCGQKDYCIRRREVENACLNCIVPRLYARVAAHEDAGLSPEGVEYALRYLNSTSTAEIKGFEGVSVDRLLELAAADKEGRVVVLPFTSGRTLLCEENIDGLRLMKDVGLAIRYCTSIGIVFYMGYDIFCDLVKHGRITAVSEEAERMMEGKKDGNKTSV